MGSLKGRAALRRGVMAWMMVSALVVGLGPSTAVSAAPTCAGETATIWDGNGYDSVTDTVGGVVQITGTTGDDVILATNGKDNIDGLQGRDLICGLKGNDTIRGGAGNDTIYAANGRDVVHGGKGNDVIHGGGGNDTINGYWGNDSLNGGSGNDNLNGHNGVDSFNGGSGTDTCNDSTRFNALPKNCEASATLNPTPPPTTTTRPVATTTTVRPTTTTTRPTTTTTRPTTPTTVITPGQQLRILALVREGAELKFATASVTGDWSGIEGGNPSTWNSEERRTFMAVLGIDLTGQSVWDSSVSAVINGVPDWLRGMLLDEGRKTSVEIGSDIFGPNAWLGLLSPVSGGGSIQGQLEGELTRPQIGAGFTETQVASVKFQSTANVRGEVGRSKLQRAYSYLSRLNRTAAVDQLLEKSRLLKPLVKRGLPFSLAWEEYVGIELAYEATINKGQTSYPNPFDPTTFEVGNSVMIKGSAIEGSIFEARFKVHHVPIASFDENLELEGTAFGMTKLDANRFAIWSGPVSGFENNFGLGFNFAVMLKRELAVDESNFRYAELSIRWSQAREALRNFVYGLGVPTEDSNGIRTARVYQISSANQRGLNFNIGPFESFLENRASNAEWAVWRYADGTYAAETSVSVRENGGSRQLLLNVPLTTRGTPLWGRAEMILTYENQRSASQLAKIYTNSPPPSLNDYDMQVTLDVASANQLRSRGSDWFESLEPWDQDRVFIMDLARPIARTTSTEAFFTLLFDRFNSILSNNGAELLEQLLRAYGTYTWDEAWVPDGGPALDVDVEYRLLDGNRQQRGFGGPAAPTQAGELVIAVNKVSEQDGFMLYSDGTRQWVSPDCYARLSGAGVSSRLVSWSSEVQPLTNMPGKHSCDELEDMFGVGAPATPVGAGELVIASNKATGQDGFVLYADDTRQWVSPDCYVQLTGAGVESRLARWTTEIEPLTDAPGKHSCNELQDML